MNVRLKRARELAGYAVQLTKDEGLGTMLARGAGFVRRRCFGKKARYLPAKKVLEAQRAEMAGKNFENCQLSTISVLTPLYNTPEVFLRQFLDSFVNQTAPNGELCLTDASDAAHSSVGDIVREYQAKYQHIVYKKIENKGIAANTNAAAELASGEYLALADHDDILAPHAMYTMSQAIRQLREAGEPDGFLYSDEALFTKKIEKPLVAHFKPDYAPNVMAVRITTSSSGSLSRWAARPMCRRCSTTGGCTKARPPAAPMPSPTLPKRQRRRWPTIWSAPAAPVP